jgi:hypothetical protein
MKTAKEQATDSLPSEPGEVPRHERVHQDYVKRKIEDSIRAADEGRILSHDEVKRLFAR